MGKQTQLDESKLMTEIERLVKPFREYIESHNGTFNVTESKLVNGLRDVLDVVIYRELDDKSILMSKENDYATYARSVWGMEAFDVTLDFIDYTVLGGIVIGSNHYVINKEDVFK